MYLSLFLVCLTSWLAPALLLLPSPAFSTLKGSIITQPIHIVTLIATPSRSSEGHHSTVMDEQQKDLLRNVLMKVGLDSLLEAFVREKVSVELIPFLSEAEFEKLGVTHLGERVMLVNVAKAHRREENLSVEVKGLFSSSKQAKPSGSSTDDTSESLLCRAERICKERLNRPGKQSFKRSKRAVKPYDRPPKQLQKNLVLIDYQSDNQNEEVLSLSDYDKIFDGCIRYNSDMSEIEIREQIVKQLVQKDSLTHDLSSILPSSFDFVRCANRKVRSIDGDVPFDASGINQVYKNGSIYVRCNVSIAKSMEQEYDESNSSLFLPLESSIEQVLDTEKFACSSVKKEIVTLSDSSSDDEQLQSALILSRQTALLENQQEAGPSFETKVMPTIGHVVLKLQQQINTEKEGPCIVVRRSNVLEDALKFTKQSFDPRIPLTVEFLGEHGVDTGGLSREFFRLIAYHTALKYMDNTGCFKHNSLALQDGIYFRIGQFLAMSLLYGGSSLNLFSSSVYSFLSGVKPSEIKVAIEEVSDDNVRNILNKVTNVSTIEELTTIAAENFDVISESGFTKPSTCSCLTLSDKQVIVHTAALHHVILKSLAELQQLCDGMETLRVASAIQEHKELLSDFFVKKPLSLTADFVRKAFKSVRFSEEGSNACTKEESAYMMFLEYLYECEEGTVETDYNESDEPNKIQTVNKCRVSLDKVLAFFSGSSDVPPLGFPYDPVISFNDTSDYPTSSTCALELTLPTTHSKYKDFKEALDTAFVMHGGFGNF